MKTGKDVTQKGAYVSRCCLVDVELARQQMFPRCPKCMKLTIWESTESRSLRPNKKAA